jgi:hypothetical protein
MSPRSFLAISLLTVLLLASCAPADAPAPAATNVPPQPTVTATLEPPAPAEEEAFPATVEAAPTEVPTEIPQPVATSRGPDLEATDPATVSLAAGELQLVEFFRFT